MSIQTKGVVMAKTRTDTLQEEIYESLLKQLRENPYIEKEQIDFELTALHHKGILNLTENDLVDIESNYDFVSHCYMKLLDRPGTKDEIKAVIKQLESNSITRKMYVSTVLSSEENMQKQLNFVKIQKDNSLI